MIVIPRQLRNKEFRFIKILSKDKKPIEKNWQMTNNYTFDNAELINWLNNENNYGIICGYGDLAVIDCDKPEIAEIVEKNLPETFAVQTGSGGKHFYYIVRDMNKTIVLKDKQDNHYGEIRSTGSQIIAPNSIHPNGNRYIILKDNEIAKIHKNTIDSLFYDYISLEKEDNDHKNKQNNNIIKYDVDIQKIIDLSNFKRVGNEYQGPHPKHGSTTGANFSINTDKNVWHCFRCNSGGGVVTLIAMLNGIILCDSCKGSYITPTIFNDVVDIAKKKYGIIIDKGDEISV
jgi:hypothetical protein